MNNPVATTLDPNLAELAAFAGVQLNLALKRLSSQGFSLIALGTTMTSGWWSGLRYTTHVLQTNDAGLVETAAMNWLMSDHKKSRCVGVVMDGEIKIEGNATEALILRTRTADNLVRLMAYQPYVRATEDAPSRLLHTIVDFPAEQAVSPDIRDMVLGTMLKAMTAKAS